MRAQIDTSMDKGRSYMITSIDRSISFVIDGFNCLRIQWVKTMDTRLSSSAGRIAKYARR